MMRLKTLFVVCMLLLNFAFTAQAQESKMVIKVNCEDKETYPFIMGEGKEFDAEKPGLTIEALKSLENELGVTFEFIRDQGVRGQKMLENNRVDMLLFGSYKKEREALGVYPKRADGVLDTSLATMNLSYRLYTLKDSKLDWNGEKFINLDGKIGATKGYSIVKVLQDKGVEVDEGTSNTGDVRKLIAKRIAGLVNQQSKIDPYLNENPKIAAQIKKIKIPVVTKPYFMLFSHEFYKNHKELAEKIWDLMKYHDENERFAKIEMKY